MGKFKVWDDQLGSFLNPEFYCLDSNGKLHYMYCESKDHLTFYANECHDWIIPVHSTSKTDKNGVELFDGDIITTTYSGGMAQSIEILIWKNLTLFYMCIGKVHPDDDGVLYPIYDSDDAEFYDLTKTIKIGNKFENPELLES